MLDTAIKPVLDYYMPCASDVNQIADLFAAFSDSTRIRLISALAISELCVGDLAEALCLSQSTVSHQLKYLRDKKIVLKKRRGKTIFYYLSGDGVLGVMNACVNQLGYSD